MAEEGYTIRALLKLAFHNQSFFIELLSMPLKSCGKYSQLVYSMQQYFVRFGELMTPELLASLASKNDSMAQLYSLYNEIESTKVSENEFQALLQMFKVDWAKDSLASNLANAISGLEQQKNPIEITETLINELQTALEISHEPAKQHKLKANAHHVIEQYESEKEQATSMIPFGWKTIDKEVGGMQRGDVVAVVGPTGGGKTTFLVNLACNVFEAGYKVLFVSLEVPLRRMRSRFHARLLGMNYTNLIWHQSNMAEYKKQLARLNEYEGEVTIVDLPQAINASYLKSFIIKEQPDIIFVDYINLMEPMHNYRDDWLRQGQIANELKMLARRHEVVVVTAAQLNRAGNERDDLRIGDIGRSFAITNPCTFVFGIRAYEQSMQLRVLKSNDAPKLSLNFRADFSKMLLEESDGFYSHPAIQDGDIWGDTSGGIF